MTRSKPKTITVDAAELRKGHQIRVGVDAYTRVLESLSMGDLIVCSHQRTGTPRIERGMTLIFRKTEKVEVLAEVQP